MKKPLFDPEPIPCERISKQGYQGFTITQKKPHRNGVTVTASNHSGILISVNGTTEEAAMKNLIDKIDRLPK